MHAREDQEHLRAEVAFRVERDAAVADGVCGYSRARTRGAVALPVGHVLFKILRAANSCTVRAGGLDARAGAAEKGLAAAEGALDDCKRLLDAKPPREGRDLPGPVAPADSPPWLLIGIPSTPRGAGVDYLNPTLDYLLEQFPRDPDDPLYMRYRVLVVNNAHGRPHPAFDAARVRIAEHSLAA